MCLFAFIGMLIYPNCDKYVFQMNANIINVTPVNNYLHLIK